MLYMFNKKKEVKLMKFEKNSFEKMRGYKINSIKYSWMVSKTKTIFVTDNPSRYRLQAIKLQLDEESKAGIIAAAREAL